VNIGFNRSASELSFDGANIWAHPSNDFDANLEAHRRDCEAPFPSKFRNFPGLVEKAFIARANYPEEAIIIEPAGSV
jgi:all-trans-retinol 13,14-reductase